MDWLRRYDLLDSAPEQALDDLALLTARVCEVPVALIGLLDGERLWFKAKAGPRAGGLSGLEIARATSLCTYTVASGELLIVPDTATEPRFAVPPPATGEPNLRFYAGEPLRTPEGQAFGTLSVLDFVPRQFTTVQQETLRMLARQLMTHLEGRRENRDLAAREEHLRLALDAARIGTFDRDLVSGEITGSAWHDRLWGFKPGEFDGSLPALSRLLEPDDLVAINSEVDAAMAARRPFAREFRVKRPDGSTAWLLGRGEFTFDSTGTAVSINGTIQDVTDRKRAEAAARHMTQRLTLATDAASIGIWDWDLTTDQWYASPVYCSMLGYPPDTGPSDRALWVERLHPDDREAVVAKIQAVIAGNEAPYTYEARMRHADGSYHWISVVGRVFSVDERGKATRMLGVRTDITARKVAELRNQQLNRVHAVLSGINEAIVREKDATQMLSAACSIAVDDGRFRMAWVGLVDPDTGQMGIVAHAGASSDTLEMVRSLLPQGAPPDCSFVAQALQTDALCVCNDIESDPRAKVWRTAALERDYRGMASLPLKRGDQTIGTFNLYAGEVGFFDGDEMPLLQKVAANISFALEVQEAELARARMERALRESEDRFRQLAENIKEVFWVIDPTGSEIQYISPAYETVWGRSCASLYLNPCSWLDAVHPEDRARITRAMEPKENPGDYDEIYRILLPDQSVRWIHGRAYPVRDATGTLLRVVGTAEDITERRQLEEQFRQSQKMEAIGQLAGGVAHDFNNILAAMMMQADIASKLPNQAEGTRELLLDIKTATNRAANLTRQLLAFSRRQVIQPRMVNLNEVVSNLSSMLERILGEDVEVRLQLHPRPLVTRADAGMLDQVLMNLVVNARDAMPLGGRLHLRTEERVLSAAQASSIPEASPGRYVCLRVSDTGSGIAPGDLPRVFEPFFTTKEPGKGTGLGLATVFGIVKQHHGWLTVDTEVGRGSRFEVFLPAADQSSLPEPAQPVEAKAPRGAVGTETVLLVEDEPVVRRFSALVLEQAGYRVLEARDGADGLRVWEQHQDSIKLLMTDIVMPGGIDGRELAARLLARNTALRVLLTSGYSVDIAGRELAFAAGQGFIEKPFTPDQLLQTVRKCLDA